MADLMIGRDLGVGANRPELEFGLRIADLHAAAQALQFGQSTTNINSLTTLYSSNFPPRIGTTTSSQSSSSSSSSFVLTQIKPLPGLDFSLIEAAPQ